MSRRGERGVALIIALVLVALAAMLATKLTFDGWLERRRSSGVLAAEQAFEFGMGAEALAADVLGQNGQKPQTTPAGPSGQSAQSAQNSSQVTLAQAWAQPTPPLPITPENDPEGEPIGTLQGSLEDMQGRFNLNNLGHVILVNGKVEQDPQPLEQFQRLLVAVGLEPKWAGIARDWIDADDQPGTPDGAEDSVYTAQSPPYLTGNWPMTSPSELMNLPGFGADRYRKIAPYVTALPLATATINICTAPARGARESRRESERRVFRQSGAAHQCAHERLFSRCSNVHQHLGPQRPQGGQAVLGQELLLPAHHAGYAWHYAVHLVQSFVARYWWQGDAAAAHIRNTLDHMPHTLLLRLPAAGQEDTEWVSIDETGLPTAAKQRGPLTLAAAVARSAKVVVLAPATQILLAEPELPPGSGVKLARAVPFALEEQLTEDIDQLCFALGRRHAGGRTPVAVVARSVLQGWISALSGAGIEPYALYADIALVPENPGQTVLWLEGARLAVRRPGMLPFAVELTPVADALAVAGVIPDPLEEESELKPLESAILYATREDWTRVQDDFGRLADKFASLKIQLLPEGPLPWLARSLTATDAVNLLQGEFARVDGLRRTLAPMANGRPARGGAPGAARCGSGARRFTGPTARRPPSTPRSPRCFRRRCPRKQCTIRAARCSRVSSASAAPDPARNTFLRILEALSGAISAMPNTIIDTLSYREQTLDLKVKAPSVAALSQLSQLVAKQGLTAEIQSSTPAGAAVEAHLQIRSAAAKAHR